MMKSLMLSCQKASFLIAKREEGKLEWKEHLQLDLHLSMCKFCKLFERQSAFISRQIKNFTSASELTLEDKARIVKALEQE